jgi:hypothetical protein
MTFPHPEGVRATAAMSNRDNTAMESWMGHKEPSPSYSAVVHGGRHPVSTPAQQEDPTMGHEPVGMSAPVPMQNSNNKQGIGTEGPRSLVTTVSEHDIAAQLDKMHLSVNTTVRWMEPEGGTHGDELSQPEELMWSNEAEVAGQEVEGESASYFCPGKCPQAKPPSLTSSKDADNEHAQSNVSKDWHQAHVSKWGNSWSWTQQKGSIPGSISVHIRPPVINTNMWFFPAHILPVEGGEEHCQSPMQRKSKSETRRQ